MMGAAAELTAPTSPDGESLCASILVNEAPAVSPQTSCAEVHAMLHGDSSILAVAVVRGERPIGLVGRLEFLANMARPFWPELFNRKPITKLMDPAPLIVEWDRRIDQIGDVLLSCKPKAMIDGFIVTRNGAYNGVATATELMRMTSTIARQRFDRLSGALHQVTEANAAKAKFLANVSHELRTPLNAIIGFSDLLSRRLYGPLTEQQCEHVGYINHSGQLLLSLVDDLLNLSVAEAQQMELHEETVELRKLSAACAKLVEPRAAKAGISLKTELGAQALALRVDEVKLKQILLNLLTNAVKFTPAGGEVRLSLATSLDGEIRIVIADNGIGIREEDIKVILQPFGQAHDKRAHPHQGAGLGLPLSKALIELHGGTLLLRSRLNFGTEVEIRLPAERRVTDGSTHAGAAGCGQQDIA
ncbi:MAG TPA: hypothetical protein EYP07_02315 [Kiloniellaceae bacterium]|nr:hypothetical protein [Kiloniellaceae bacterium]